MASTPSRVTMAAITACVVAAGVGAGLLLQPTKDRPAPAARGPNVSIDVVAPREPEPEPGGVMEVGDLADGYLHRGYVQPSVEAPPYDVPEDNPPARVEPARVERPREIVLKPAPAPVMAERREAPAPPRFPFGFDQPRPDYAAERRERTERRDEQRRFEEARLRERYETRDDYPEPSDDRAREAGPDSDRGGRDRQWYASDGRRVPGPEAYD